MKKLLIIILSAVVCCIVSSCRVTQPIVGPVVEHDTLIINHQAYDSIYIHDSIWTVIEHKGDTVIIEKAVYKTEYRDRWHTDSVYVSQRDTITQQIITNELTSWQTFQIRAFDILVVVMLILMSIYFLFKR